MDRLLPYEFQPNVDQEAIILGANLWGNCQKTQAYDI